MVCERAEKILCFIRNIKNDSKFAIPNRQIRSLLQHVDARFMNYLKWSTFCRHKKVKRKSRNIALCEKCPNAEVFLFFLSVFGHFSRNDCLPVNYWMNEVFGIIILIKVGTKLTFLIVWEISLYSKKFGIARENQAIYHVF